MTAWWRVVREALRQHVPYAGGDYLLPTERWLVTFGAIIGFTLGRSFAPWLLVDDPPYPPEPVTVAFFTGKSYWCPGMDWVQHKYDVLYGHREWWRCRGLVYTEQWP